MLDRRKKGPLVVPSSTWVRQHCAFQPLGKAGAEYRVHGRRDAGWWAGSPSLGLALGYGLEGDAEAEGSR